MKKVYFVLCFIFCFIYINGQDKESEFIESSILGTIKPTHLDYKLAYGHMQINPSELILLKDGIVIYDKEKMFFYLIDLEHQLIVNKFSFKEYAKKNRLKVFDNILPRTKLLENIKQINDTLIFVGLVENKEDAQILCLSCTDNQKIIPIVKSYDTNRLETFDSNMDQNTIKRNLLFYTEINNHKLYFFSFYGENIKDSSLKIFVDDGITHKVVYSQKGSILNMPEIIFHKEFIYILSSYKRTISKYEIESFKYLNEIKIPPNNSKEHIRFIKDKSLNKTYKCSYNFGKKDKLIKVEVFDPELKSNFSKIGEIKLLKGMQLSNIVDNKVYILMPNKIDNNSYIYSIQLNK